VREVFLESYVVSRWPVALLVLLIASLPMTQVAQSSQDPQEAKITRQPSGSQAENARPAPLNFQVSGQVRGRSNTTTDLR
jgi:hypothetical protein